MVAGGMGAVTLRIRLCRLSAMYMLPAPSNVMLAGRFSSACVARFPSCTKVQRPSPATERTFPGTSTPNPPNPVPESSVVPKRLPALSRRTTAPRRRPGNRGVNVTDSMQVWLAAVKTAVSQVNAPTPFSKSSPLAPSVSMLTWLTAPATCELTVTFCAPEVAPTGCGAPKTACAWAASAASSRAAKPSAQLRKRAGTSRAPTPSFAGLRSHWHRLARY